MKKELLKNMLKVGDCVKYNKILEKKETIGVITTATRGLNGTFYIINNSPKVILPYQIIEKMETTPRRKLK